MILLTQDTTNKIALTLAEKCTLTGITPSYLFQFTNTNSREQKLFTGVDLSVCKARYNEFNIVLTSTTENLTGGTISIENGTYDYTIYSMSAATNLDISATTEVVEVGIAKVIGSATTKSEYSNIRCFSDFFHTRNMRIR